MSCIYPDQWLEEGDKVTVGNLELDVLHCPGHTPGHVVFVDKQDKLISMGDVLFRGASAAVTSRAVIIRI